ncbi:MAG: hypothetical protein HDS72_09080 [Bacteroidales bacterium]|nr:hypothetical protein [Bacteroidales bacterium]
MKEFNEADAVRAMAAAVAPEHRNDDAITEVLDLIFDGYEENGLLDIDADDNVSLDDDAEVVTDYVCRMLRKNPSEVNFSDDEIRAMVEAELDYEESLLN